MRLKNIIMLSVFLTFAAGAYVLFANPIGWSDKPNLEYWSMDFDKRVELHLAIWKDGSAEAWVRPIQHLPEEQLPRTGLLTVDDKSYKFAERIDRDGQWGFFCSVPVEGIPMQGSFVLDLVVDDSTGHRLLHEHTEPTLNFD